MIEYLLVGAGGTGSHLLGPLLAYLDTYHGNKNEEWHFLVADGDTFETKNQDRQIFDPAFIGLNKADAMYQMYRGRYPIESYPYFLGRVELENLMGDGVTVFIGVDNYSVRALIEERALNLDNVVVVNGGNEYHDGSVQLWVREGGKNLTPRLSYLHPEIKYISDDDRSEMTCAQVAALPGGGQMIIANMAAAQHMLTALWRYHSDAWRSGWTMLEFDLLLGEVNHLDMRTHKNWELDANPAR